MHKPKLNLILPIALFAMIILLMYYPIHAGQAPEIKFDHIHTYTETAAYLERVVQAYPKLTKLRKIGKSYLGKDPLITKILDTKTFFIMPKLNPDGSEYAITKPGGMRSVVRPGESDYYNIEVDVRNIGSLPTYVTKQSLLGELAKTVKATISLTNAELVSGGKTVDLGHLEGSASRQDNHIGKVEWVVKAKGNGNSTAVIKAISEKGGTHTKEITLTK